MGNIPLNGHLQLTKKQRETTFHEAYTNVFEIGQLDFHLDAVVDYHNRSNSVAIIILQVKRSPKS